MVVMHLELNILHLYVDLVDIANIYDGTVKKL